ncbi:NAD(P)H-hydrate dehydratase [Aurantivibrio infirmus]
MFAKIVDLAQLPDSMPLYSAAECREIDRRAIEDEGISGIVLMKRAARAAFTSLLERWPNVDGIIVFCGSGNNAGDGYLMASLAAEKTIPTTVVLLAEPNKLKGDAKLAFEHVLGINAAAKGSDPGSKNSDPIQILSLETLDETPIRENTVVVDALLGTGISGSPKANFLSAIEWINHSPLPVLSVDIPSGLNADTGDDHSGGRSGDKSNAVKADLTVSFVGLKRGLFTAKGPGLIGDIEFSDLGIPAHIVNSQLPSARLLNLPECLAALPDRSLDSHKGDFGHVLVIGGDHGFGGAAMMAAEAAARVGAGLVTLATREEHCLSMLARRPEIMVKGVESTNDLVVLIEKATTIVIGPGLGQSEWSKQLFKLAIKSALPLMIDADALNLLSEQGDSFASKQNNWILSPHPGEASRLLNMGISEVQSDRFASVANLQARFQCVSLLKGRGTLIADGKNPIAVANVGNPGMASGGMGDILSGVIGGLLAQGLDLASAASLGVMLHGVAADRAAQKDGQRGMLATDLLPYLRQLVNR